MSNFRENKTGFRGVRTVYMEKRDKLFAFYVHSQSGFTGFCAFICGGDYEKGRKLA